MSNYEIAHRTGVCALTQRTLLPGDQFYAVLFDTPDGFERRDYSTEASISCCGLLITRKKSNNISVLC